MTLELGGKSAQVVFDDADLERALPTLVNAIIQNGGQTCSAGSRLLIQRGIFQDVVDAVAERFGKLSRRASRARARSRADDQPGAAAPRAGLSRARPATRASPSSAKARSRSDAPAGGYLRAPAFLAPVPHESLLSQEEVFGPVLVATPFEDEAEAIRLANGTPYGLVGGGVDQATPCAPPASRAPCAPGQVFVNCYGAGGGIELPFGGFGRSGHGREKGFEGLVEFTTTKTLVIAHG